MSSHKPLLEDTGKGLTIKFRDRYLYSKYSPIDRIDRKISQLTFKEQTLYIIPSPLLFYGVIEIEKHLPTTSKLLFIEVDRELYEVTTLKEIVRHIITGFDFFSQLNAIDFNSIRNIELLPLNGAFTLHQEAYNRLFNHSLNYLHNYWKNRYTLTQMGMLWIKNSMRNIRNIKNHLPFTELKTDKVIVVIGAGESAETYLDYIKECRDQIFLYCVDTALQVLLDVDIKPDLVLALEAQYYNLPDFYGASGLDIDVLYDLSSYPGVLKVLTGKKYYSITSFSDNSLLKKVRDITGNGVFLPPLGSVGITAIYTALQITSNRVFLAGLDFSYNIGKTHSRGTPYHHSTLETMNRLYPGDSYINCLKRPLITVPNKRGIPENTDTILLDYAKHTKELLHGINRVYDLTNRGMDIGVSYISYEDFRKLIMERSIIEREEKVKTPRTNLYLEEIEKIESVKSSIKSYIETKTPQLLKIKEQLREIDYLFIYFPENDPVDTLSDSNILRFYYSIIRYLRLFPPTN